METHECCFISISRQFIDRKLVEYSNGFLIN